MNKDLIFEPGNDTTLCRHTYIEREQLTTPLIFSQTWTSTTLNPSKNSTDLYYQNPVTRTFSSPNINTYDLTLTLYPYRLIEYTYPDTTTTWRDYVANLICYANYEGTVNLTYNNTTITDVFINVEPLDMFSYIWIGCYGKLEHHASFKPQVKMQIITNYNSTVNYLI